MRFPGSSRVPVARECHVCDAFAVRGAVGELRMFCVDVLLLMFLPHLENIN